LDGDPHHVSPLPRDIGVIRNQQGHDDNRVDAFAFQPIHVLLKLVRFFAAMSRTVKNSCGIGELRFPDEVTHVLIPLLRSGRNHDQYAEVGGGQAGDERRQNEDSRQKRSLQKGHQA
jgi:hypothetical protein